MNLEELLAREPNAETLELWLKKVPYGSFLGIKAEVTGDDILFILPANEKLVGNPSIPAIHGGVVAAFMEQAANFQLIAKMEKPILPKVINFSLDYLRPVKLKDTFAACEITRQGKMVAHVSITTWQEDRGKPNATARAHFMISE